ncbi:MAG: DNA polymerase I [Gammaproteobacteria bacterium]|nr:DNA polymerase I [Gammaproteobacteria bacterium]
MPADKQIILVDGSSFLFRAYHAIREPLTNSRGQTTHAVFGMLNMLRSLIRQRQPERIAVVLDAKGKNFRHKLYKDYKANRPPMPDDLRAQQEYLKKIIPAMGVALVSVPGVEADDVIGTLAERAGAAGYDTLMISGDKDLTQLVGKRVMMEDTMKNLRLDRDGVVKKFGVPPERMVEYLALVGDTSDNIPGVPKVGPKTAVKWLGEFGTLEKIVARAAEIPGKVGESLRANLKQLELARQLATIKRDVELDIDLDDLRIGKSDIKKLRAFFTELEFRSWLKQLDGGESGGEKSPAEKPGEKSPEKNVREKTDYATITDEKTLEKWIAKLSAAEIFALDTETTSTDAHRAELVGISFAAAGGEAAYLPLAHGYVGAPPQIKTARAIKLLRPLLQDAKRAKTMQNMKYDFTVLRRHGINLAGVTHDTMLMSYLLDAGNSRHDLDTLAQKHLGHTMVKFSDVAGTGKKQLTFDQVHIEPAAHYAAEDADFTLQLQRKLAPRLDGDRALSKLFREIEMPLVSVLARMESNGVKVDAEMLARQSASIAKRLKKVEKAAHKSAGEEFNIASPKQIQEILYEKQGIAQLRKTPKGQASTAESVLQILAHEHELPRLILEHRGLAKLKNTYTEKLPTLINPQTGRIHTSFHQAVAATGRLSSSDPNLQNIPIRTEDGRRIREAFVAEPGHVLVSADYSQIELRIMAHLSADAGLCEAFGAGLDVHRATAAEVFGVDAGEVSDEQRRRAKAINFGLIYGMSAFGLARQLQIEQREAREYIEIYFARYPGVKRYMERTREMAREQGYVETLYGRRLHLPEIQSKNAARRQYAERTAINAPMQGSAADLIKLAMLAVDKWISGGKSRAKMILQVHDELVLEAPKGEAAAVAKTTAKLMTDVASLKVPLVVDTGAGANWKEAH